MWCVTKIADIIPARLNVGVMVFCSSFFFNMLTNQMSINLLAMVQPISPTYVNGTLVKPPDYGPRYSWSAYDQSLLLGSNYWGHAIASIPSGIFSARTSSRMLLTYSFLLSALLTALGPLGAYLSYWMMLILRLLLGVSLSLVYPVIHKLIAHWAPPHERGKFMSGICVSTIGIATSWSIAGILIETVGWVYAFYVPAIVVVIFTLVLYLIVYDSPTRHPRITTKEKDYIESHLKELSFEKSWPPMLSIARSVPFWALLILHFGSMWGNTFLNNGAPKYMNEVFGFNISNTGVLASLPSFSRCIFGLIFGCVGDWTHRKKCMSVTNLRKFFCIFSHMIPGLFMIGMIFVSDRPYFSIAFMSASLGFNGAAAMTNLQNSQDLSPNYAATLYAIISTTGTTTGFVTPLVIAFFTKESNTAVDWNILFMISGGLYFVTALVFLFFGSGDIQKWNTFKPENVNDK